MAQTVRPVTDLATTGTWAPSTGSSLAQMLDEPVGTGDTTFVDSPATAGPNTATLALGSANTPQSGTVTLRVRSRAPASGGGSATRALLTSSDITYLGAFQVPMSGVTGDRIYARGLTHRYVGGQLRLFTRYLNGGIIEFLPAAPKTTYNFNVATTVRNWGSAPWAGKLPGPAFAGDPGPSVAGLHWDEGDQRLYWNMIHGYTASGSTHATFGYATLNDATGTATANGVWFMPDPPNYKPFKGMCAIPAIYHARLGGKRIALGFGGYESIVTTGAASLGPTLAPIALTTLPAEGATLDPSAFQVLVNHPVNTTPYTSPWKGKRNPNYIQAYDGWHPQGGVGYWTWSDEVKQSGVWIDTGTKQGFLVICRQATGNESAAIASFSVIAGLQYAVTLSEPLANVRVGDILHVPNGTEGAYYANAPGRVDTITSSTQLTITVQPTAADPNATLGPGTLYRRTAYITSTLWSTEGRLAGFLYDSEVLISGGYSTDLVPYAEEFALPSALPDRIGSWANDGTGFVSEAGLPHGATFDPTDNKLYVLFRDTNTGGWRNSIVCVYQVS